MKQSITTQVQDLTQSLHNTQGQVDTVQQELAVQKDTIRIVNTELKNEQAQNRRLTAEVKRLNEDLLNLETYSRKHNLIIDGLKEVQDEYIEIVVGDFIKQNLKIEQQIDIDKCHRIGMTTKGRSRQVIVRFTRLKDRDSLRKGLPSPIWINENYPTEIRQRRSTLNTVVRHARSLGHRATLSADKCIINGRA